MVSKQTALHFCDVWEQYGEARHTHVAEIKLDWPLLAENILMSLRNMFLTQKSERFDSLYTWREGCSQVMNRLVVFLVLVAFLALRLNEAKACKCRRCCWELPILSWLHAGTQNRNLELIRSWHGDPEIGPCMKQILRFPCCFLTHVPTLEILKSFHFLGKRHPRLICREHATKVLGGKKALNKPW